MDLVENLFSDIKHKGTRTIYYNFSIVIGLKSTKIFSF